MIWVVPKMGRRSFGFLAGFIALTLIVFWIFKIRNIQRLRGDIVQLEVKLGKGQELWKSSPPLTVREKEELRKAQERLLLMLPKEKDVPSVLQEVSRVARDYTLANLSLSTGDGAVPSSTAPPSAPASGAPQTALAQSVPQVPAAAAGSPGPINSFTVKVTFAGDYQEIAIFLEALQKSPRLMTIQSLQLQRGIPLIVAEVVLNAYYLKGSLPVKLK